MSTNDRDRQSHNKKEASSPSSEREDSPRTETQSRRRESDAPRGRVQDDAFERARAVVEDSEQLADDLSELYEQVTGAQDLRDLYERNPYAFLAAAAGTGYVLGGGLLTPFTRRIARIGMKAVLVPFAISRLKEVAENLPQDEELPFDPPETQQ